MEDILARLHPESQPGILVELNGLAPPPWVPASSIQPEEVDWLWEPRIPRGMLTVVAGDPGLGKSQFTTALAARISRGVQLPDSESESPHGTVMMACLEDSLSHTVVPRLIQQDADLSKILFPQICDQKTGKVHTFCESDLPILEAHLDEVPDIAMLVIDPIMAFMGGQRDAHRDNVVREVLTPLKELAERRHIAVVCVAHLNKSDAASVLYKVSGSIAFVAAARSILLVGRDENTDRRAIAHLKTNLGPYAAALLFSIDNMGFHFGQSDARLSVDSLVKHLDSRTKSYERDTVCDWLSELLSKGPVPAVEAWKLAKELEFSEMTVKRAKSHLGVDTFQRGRAHYWFIPDVVERPEDR